MFWPFRIRPRRQSTRPSDYTRLGIEVLEGRPVPSVLIMPVIGPAKAGAMGVMENERDQTTTITDIFLAGTTTVVPDEMTQTFGHVVTLFDLELVAPSDPLFFDLAGIYSQRLADILVPPGEE